MSNKVLNLAASFDVTKAVDDDESLVIEGYANTTDKDRAGDVVLEEAWNKGGLDNYLQNPIILGFHKHDNPIGKMTSHSVNSKGLFISAKISKAAGHVYDLIKDGILRTFSIGFRVLDADYNSDTDIFVIKDLELLEVSVVSIPANQFSLFSVRKGFDTEDEFNKFKEEYSLKQDEAPQIIPEEEDDMPLTPEEMKKIEDKLAARMKAEADAKAAAEAARKAEEDKMKSVAIEVGTTESEKLMKAVEERMAEKDSTIQSALDAVASLKEELESKEKEMKDMVNSRMHFTDNRDGFKPDTKAQDDAVLLAKILGKNVEDTDFGKEILTKSDQTHQGTSMTTQDWEQEFSMRLMEDIEQALVVEPLFPTINMNTITMNIPTNPAAGYAQWITSAAFASTDGTSTGADENHTLGATSITAHKLASKDRVSYEEEEDLIIPFMDVIRTATIERMARASDKALLVGDIDDATPSNATHANVYPFDGIGTIATEVAANGASVASDSDVTALILQSLRPKMGKFGLNPADLVYIVNTQSYYDLLKDPEFRTVEKVGNVATALRGEVGSVNGVRVIVSNEFDTASTTAPKAICANMRNYLKGTLRSLMVERDRDIENQTNVIVATRRMGMIQLFAGTANNHSAVSLVDAT